MTDGTAGVTLLDNPSSTAKPGQAPGGAGRVTKIERPAVAVDPDQGPGQPSQPAKGFGLQSLALLACGLMAFSGSLKEVVPFSLIPGDLTLLTTLAAFALSLLYTIFRGSVPARSPVWVLVLLTTMAVSGAVHQVSTELAETKLLRLFIVSLAATLTVALAVRDHDDAFRLLRFMLVIAAGHAVWINIGGERQYEGIGRLITEDGTTISFGRAAGFVMVACLAWVISSPAVTAGRLVLVGAVVAFHLWTMFAIAAKGPALGLGLALAAMAALQLRRVAVRTAVRMLVMFGAMAVALSMVWTRIPESSRARFINVSDSGSVGVRSEAFSWTWREVSGSPFGHGWGSWNVLSPIKIEYPHNLVLEVWFEAGVIGLVALLGVFWLALANQDRVFAADRVKATLMVGTLVFWLTAGMVSGQVNDNKVLYVVLVAAAAPVVRATQAPRPIQATQAPRPVPATQARS